MKNHLLLLSLAAIALLTSCDGRNDVEYIPFMEREDGRWGLVSTDGKVLFSEEFERRPSVVTNGRFVAETKDGRYEIYTAEEKPKTVGGRYVDAGYYQDGLIPVAEEGGHVKYLDTDGAEAFTLSKVEGKDVTRASVFSEGLAVFEAGGYYGAVDTKGRVVVKPEYIELQPCRDGKLVGVSKRYEQVSKAGQREKMRATILGSDGKELGTFALKEVASCWGGFVDGAMAAAREREGEHEWGLMDEKGEWLVAPSDRCRSIGGVQGDLFTFSDGEKWGVMNRKGEVVIRAKYDMLYFAADGILAVQDEAYDEKRPWYFIDTDDNRLGSDSYEDVTVFYDGKHAFAKYSERSWILLDAKGEKAECEADIYDLAFYATGNTWVESDYVDAAAIVAQLGITASGAGTYRVGMTAEEAIAATRKGGGAPSESPEDYRYDDDLGYEQQLGKLTATYRTIFPLYIGEDITETRRESYGYFYYDHEVVTGHRFRTQQSASVAASLNLSGKRMEGKTEKFLDAMKKKVRSLGSVVRENGGALLVRAGGNTLLAYRRGAEVGCIVMAGDRSDLDISDYATGDEDDDYAEGSDSASVEWVTDSATIDSTVAGDSTVAR